MGLHNNYESRIYFRESSMERHDNYVSWTYFLCQTYNGIQTYFKSRSVYLSLYVLETVYVSFLQGYHLLEQKNVTGVSLIISTWIPHI